MKEEQKIFFEDNSNLGYIFRSNYFYISIILLLYI